MDERSKRVEIDSDYVLNTIRETVDRCRQVRPVLDREGNPVLVETPSGDITPAFTFEPNAVLKGCELLGRHLKMFTDKLEVKVNATLAERYKKARERLQQHNG